MIISVDQLIINCDDVVLIKGDVEYVETKTSRFRWLQPSTWGLDPVVTTKTKYYTEINYTKDKRSCKFTYYVASSKAVTDMMSQIAIQMKAQMGATNQEALDKAFENAIKEA